MMLLLPSLPPSSSTAAAAAAAAAAYSKPSARPSIPQANILPKTHRHISMLINRSQGEGGREGGREGEGGEDLPFACVENLDYSVFRRRVELMRTMRQGRPF